MSWVTERNAPNGKEVMVQGKPFSCYAEKLWSGDILALIGGLFGPFAFAPYNFYILAIISPALLFATCRNISARRAFWRGWLFGLGWFGFGISWIYIAIHDWGRASAFLALSLTGLLAAVLSLFPALLAGIVTFWFAHESKGKYLLGWPALWVLLERLRGWILTGFPWLNLGYSQIESPLHGLAPIFGVYGVSLATVFSSGLILVARYWPGRIRFIAFGGLGALWGLGLFCFYIPWTIALNKTLQVSLIQGNNPQAVKWQAEQVKSTLEQYWQLTAQHWDSNLIVWPEGAVSAFYHQVADSYLAFLADEARSHKTELLVGLPVFDGETEKYYNAVLSLGSREAFYYKQHLVPFGEYVPLNKYLQGIINTLGLPIPPFTPGPKNQPLLQVVGYPIATSICYEDAFGEEIISALPEAVLLVNITNNAWYGDSLAPHQHLQISRMRALETGRDLVRATTNGISAIINAKGILQAITPQFKAATLTGNVQLRSGTTPYVFWGNRPVIGACLCMFVIGGYYQRYRKEKKPA
ncbi:apolipoprotein N-acyltransferase [Candidatus Nitrosoglobus terrae]|uniref:Apolipoprotein N-acyltransferase n=1 Tax=Candidatus Nitrosoglobus terrae TaxID=1630141 RepID=A0A1Q2SPQ1_9GAMM|nr:apolipoprotein N-acyltransferase [Candidatus Nitrosoglobus terrae]BAW81145.1 apolipoprotein N-acyltransferase [Candidatus Nitrosoglobus terrae]